MLVPAGRPCACCLSALLPAGHRGCYRPAGQGALPYDAAVRTLPPLKHAARPGWGERHHEPYSTLAVAVVLLATLLVPVLALAGQARVAVIWLGTVVLALAVVRILRPQGSWIAARGRAFDVGFGIVLGMGLLALSWYAVLPAPGR